MRINDVFTEKIKLSEDASGIDFNMQIDQDTGSFATVTARAHGRTLGSVEFFVDGDVLVADQLEVDERYRGQGIAAAMYDYAKSQGYTIQKSPDLTPDGDHFWNKNRGDNTVWEDAVPTDKKHIQQLAKQLLCLAHKELHFKSFPTVKFIDSTDRQSFGYFDPATDSIHVVYANRNEMDIMRTLAHELVHHRQRETESHMDGSTGSHDENQANDMAGVIMRNFAAMHPEYFDSEQINELGNAPAEFKPNRKRKNSLFHATVEGHWVDVFFDRSEFNDTLHITFTVDGNYDTPSQPNSASKSTVKILSTVLNVVKQRLPEYIKKSRPPGVSFTAKEDNRAGLYRKYFVPVIQNILGAKWQHEEYPSMGMTVFHWRPVRKTVGEELNEISDKLLQNYLSRSDRQISRRLDRMSQARERLNKNYEIYNVNKPTRIIDRFEANTPAQAEEYYYKFIKEYNPGDQNFEFGLRRSTGVTENVTEDNNYMAGHCHVMAIALKMLHPDWQIRAHVGWEDDTAEDDEYRVDHVYTVAPDGSAYDCRGRFDSEEALVGEDATGGFETQYADFDLADIEQLVRRGELKRFTRQDIDHAMRFAKQIGQQGVAEGFSLGNMLPWPEVVNKINSAMRAMGWKGQRKNDGSFIFTTRGAMTDEYYIVIIDNEGDSMFTYALGTVEEGNPHIGEQDTLPTTEASVSELMNAVRDGFGLNENFADGKNPGRKGLAKRSGVNTKASVSSLRKTAKHSTGEKARMAHWLANMKAGRARAKKK